MIRARPDGQGQTEGGHILLKVQAVLFYTHNRVVASTDLVWLQTVFDILTRLFYWVRLKTNVQNQWRWYAIHTGRLVYVQTNLIPSGLLGGGVGLQGKTEGSGQLPQVRKITDKGVTGYALPYQVRRGKWSYITRGRK